jgi:PAS domain S-box-containing protein
VLAAILDTAWAGIMLADAQGRYVYVNPAGADILGRPAEELLGRPFADSFVSLEQRAISRRLDATPIDHDRTGLFTATVALPDGGEREITYSNAVFEIAGNRYIAAVFRDSTDTTQAVIEAAALAQTATQLAGGDDPTQILGAIAGHAVSASRAIACGIAVLGDDGSLRSAGGFNLPMAMRDAITDGSTTITDLPGGRTVASGRVAELSDARGDFAANPRTQRISELLADLDWQGGVFLPMRWGGKVVGVFGLYLPPCAERATAQELAFWQTLSDQAASALAHARQRNEREQHAAVVERQRLARELHDSVSQALFSMTLHARTAEVSLQREGVPSESAAARSVAQLRELTQGALAEMRALIFELRPGALAEEGLVAALGKQAAAISAREQLPIVVTGPAERPELGESAEEHLYRIALEALNNTIKHAGASKAEITVTTTEDVLQLTVTDDGQGFDTSTPHPGHLGLGTMADRAAAAGAVLTVDSEPGSGTRVHLHLPRQRKP